MDRPVLMHTQIKREIIGLAIANPTEEVCGFIWHDREKAHVLPCRNVAQNPTEEFEIGVEDQILLAGLGAPLGIYHSHPSTAAFSPEDLEYAQETAVPHYLYSVPDQQWHEYVPPSYDEPLEGQPFVLGFKDCYSIVRDYYRHHLGRHLRDYDRDESFVHEEQGVIMENFEREGFEFSSLATIQIHDLILFKSDKALPQHFGIFVGNSRFLHHSRGMLSRVELLTDHWFDRLLHVFHPKPGLISV